MKKQFLLAAAAAIFAALPASAATVIGTPLGPTDAMNVVTGNEYLSAGFTMSGTYSLASATVRIAAEHGTLLLRLFGGGAGGPSGAALATFNGSPGSTMDAYSFSASPLLLQAGTTYWLTLSLLDPDFGDAVSWSEGLASPSGPGAMSAGYRFGFGELGSETFPVGGTLAYSIEGASLSAVPEPATWGLLILGFGTIGAATRRRPCKGNEGVLTA